MKTTYLFIIATLLFTSPVKSNENPEIIKQLSHYLTLPMVLKENQPRNNNIIRVPVNFVVNQDGNVIEVNANITNAEAKRDIEKQFMQLNLKGLKACLLHKIEINFVTL